MFFKTPPFGLDISDHSIEMISLKGSFYSPRFFAMGRRVLKPGIVEDAKILNKEILKKTLLDLIKSPEFGKIKTNKFIFSLPESKTFTLIFKLPKGLTKKKELDFIKSEVNQNLPFKIEDLYLDFRINSFAKQSHGKEVFLVAATKKIVNDYLEFFKSLGLYPVIMETESESFGRSLIQDSGEAVLVVDIGARTTNFSIFDAKKIRFSSTFEVAGNKFTECLANGLKISLNEADRFKKRNGLSPKAKQGRVFLILQKEVQAIVLEIRDIEKYFQKKENKEIKKIILAGGSAMLPLLPKYLEENLGKQVVIGEPWTRINIDILRKKQYVKKALNLNPILYTVCIGSALRGLMKDSKQAGINLIKK